MMKIFDSQRSIGGIFLSQQETISSAGQVARERQLPKNTFIIAIAAE
jgi:hypothetical protein